MKKLIKKFIYKNISGFVGRYKYFDQIIFLSRKNHLLDRVIQEGIFEHNNLKIIEKLIKPNTYFFDIGANIGLMSVPILKLRPDSKIAAFEPSPNTLHYLKKTWEFSPFKERWKIYDVVLSNKTEEIDFAMGSTDMGAFDGIKDTSRGGKKHTVKLHCDTLDRVWHSMNKPEVSFIKIDTEGAEMMILEGASGLINDQRPYIMLEWQATNLKAYNIPEKKLYSYAQDNNYQLYSCLDNSSIVINDATGLIVNMIYSETFLLSPQVKE